MEQHPSAVEEARKQAGLPPAPPAQFDAAPEAKIKKPPGFFGILFRSVAVFTVIGPTVPVSFIVSVEKGPVGLSGVLALYLMGLFVGLYVSLPIGLLFGTFLGLVNRFAPRLLGAQSLIAVGCKSFVLAAIAGVLAITAHLPLESGLRLRTEDFAVMSFFLFPIIVCALIASLWVLHKLRRYEQSNKHMTKD